MLQYESGQLIEQLKVTKIEKKAGLGRVQLQSAVAGDVVSIAGPGDAAGIADTIAAPAVTQALDPGPIDPPTLRSAPHIIECCVNIQGKESSNGLLQPYIQGLVATYSCCLLCAGVYTTANSWIADDNHALLHEIYCYFHGRHSHFELTWCRVCCSSAVWSSRPMTRRCLASLARQ